MATKSNVTQFPSPIPVDDLKRNLVVQNPENGNALHLGIVGDTYTLLLSGRETAGQFCLIDMLFLREVARLRIAMISKKRSFCSMVNWKRPFEDRNAL